jgi:hypothetical protein
MESRNDASRPLRVWLLRKPGLPGKRFREYDIAVLLESRDLFVTIRFSYVIRPSCHLVPRFASTAASVGSKLEQDRLFVAVGSLVSLKRSRPCPATISTPGRGFFPTCSSWSDERPLPFRS